MKQLSFEKPSQTASLYYIKTRAICKAALVHREEYADRLATTLPVFFSALVKDREGEDINKRAARALSDFKELHTRGSIVLTKTSVTIRFKEHVYEIHSKSLCKVHKAFLKLAKKLFTLL